MDRFNDSKMKTHYSEAEEHIDLELYRKLVRAHIEMVLGYTSF